MGLPLPPLQTSLAMTPIRRIQFVVPPHVGATIRASSSRSGCRLPAEVIERWKATGPGWQTRMAERLSKVP